MLPHLVFGSKSSWLFRLVVTGLTDSNMDPADKLGELICTLHYLVDCGRNTNDITQKVAALKNGNHDLTKGNYISLCSLSSPTYQPPVSPCSCGKHCHFPASSSACDN